METTFIYPEKPAGVDEKIMEPSADFKRDVFKTIGAIMIFILVYLLLVIAACCLAALCAYGGIALIIALPKFITIAIGIGMIGTGLMVIYFLVKFIFKTNKVDRSHLIEIKENQQPELFSFIRRITDETHTPFPKKIYLSRDVNACVFYNSGFWSMFFPVKKNLQIGLGLVNSLNVSELKAVIAHEFGHFSQRSMKLGSYTYNVNKIIYDMLYDNESYGKTLESFGNASSYFALFAGITVKIIQSIQWILRKVYAVVNKSYMSLSRQMEFHADAVAAYVSGSTPLITSLRKIEATDQCYNVLFNHYNTWINDNLKPDNIYPQHTELVKHYADYYKIPFDNNILQFNGNSFINKNTSRVNIKDQWASHPSIEDRTKHLLSLNVTSHTSEESAWSVFTNVEALQKLMTEKIFEQVQFKNTPHLLDLKEFKQKYELQEKENGYQKDYNGFYDSRNISVFQLQEAIDDKTDDIPSNFTDLMIGKDREVLSQITNTENDLQTLKTIGSGTTDIKTFDFDGEKYKQSDTMALQTRLEEELVAYKEQLKRLDRQVFRFFYRKAVEKSKAEEFVSDYQNVFSVIQRSEKDVAMYNQMAETLRPVYTPLKPDKIISVIEDVEDLELPIKERMKEMLNEEGSSPFMSDDQKEKLQEYVSKNLTYYDEPDYHQTNLAKLNEALQIFIYVSIEKNFKSKKALFENQIQLLK